MALDRRIQDLLGIELPIIQAPMAGAQGADMVIAVSEAGGLGSLPGALLTVEQMRSELGIIRQRTAKPINVNFFCHVPPAPDAAREAGWKRRLEGYYREFGLDPLAPTPAGVRAPFDDAFCTVMEEFTPEVVSFHFGLPARPLLDRVRATGARIIASATSADEARWLEDHGCDAIIAQGYEAGGHRGIFLTDAVANQAGTMALVPQVVDAVKVPVIAAGGMADGRGIAAAFALGASAVQIGTAFLFCPEARITPMHRKALADAKDDSTALTNLFTGRPARGIVNRLMREAGPLSAEAPAFPTAGAALAPLKAKAEAAGSGDFSSLWSGQAAALGREMPAGELTRLLMAETVKRLGQL
ncbi:NAD(P)H-dependent flavin oxidoreductase [Phreatobacter stygius]|uniref:Nitronate monooxygenase n=1 Tax=Phreatobacter stygius TaxID=1940610 RepID=A0A4D7B6Y7_9HYPH|nr:nitronate monooxygenase [Phreatobacter stygius]QCI65456.1 nitronate monooxygenase [Phreatobacter stygius]